MCVCLSLRVRLFYPKTRCTFPNSETLPFIQGYFLPAVWEHPYADRADGDDKFAHANTSPTHLICLQTHTQLHSPVHTPTHTHTHCRLYRHTPTRAHAFTYTDYYTCTGMCRGSDEWIIGLLWFWPAATYGPVVLMCLSVYENVWACVHVCVACVKHCPKQ